MDLVFQIGAFILAFVGQSLVVAKIIISMINKKIEDERDQRQAGDATEREERLATEAALRKILDDIRDSYLRREDFYRNFDQMKDMVTSVKGELNSNITSLKDLMGAKLDLVMNSIKEKK